MLLAELVEVVPSDMVTQLIDQMKPLLADMVLKLVCLVAGLKLLDLIMNQVMKILLAMEDQRDWERVYNSTRPHFNDREMAEIRDDFWGKGNKGTTRTRRARKNKFFVD